MVSFWSTANIHGVQLPAGTSSHILETLVTDPQSDIVLFIRRSRSAREQIGHTRMWSGEATPGGFSREVKAQALPAL